MSISGGPERSCGRKRIASPKSEDGSPKRLFSGAETKQAPAPGESLSSPERLIEAVCEQVNLRHALKRVKANKGAAGVLGYHIIHHCIYSLI